jgi:nitrate/TMAO reductase-like tetraheme cytochrome c subunit/mono/diheme cytochrome c family protein
LPFALLGVLTFAVLVGSVYGWNYTNSPEFCGASCHTMPPEYSAYLRSPHARVQCVECHLGRAVVTTQFTRKAGDLRHVVRTLTQDYEFPIRAHEMRPARDSCERCHFPEKFSDDSLRQVHRYASDEANSLENMFLIMKTGGGSERQGLGQGIHWHIENEVRFLATDPLQQEIPYVRSSDGEGNITEYYDIASGLTPEDIAGAELETMDCITCHNRVTHTIPNPKDAVDQAMSKRLIASDLPFIREQSELLLSQPYPDEKAANDAFNTLYNFYAQNYPDDYNNRLDDIQAAIDTLEDIYTQSVFAEQKIDWNTHPDNLGHRFDPGCFRCHDGKHLTSTGEAVRLECNLCHSIPEISDATSLVASLDVVRGPEPASHTHTSWITLHGKAIDGSCAACHVPENPETDYTQLQGKPPADGTFCGNSACHVSEWEYTGFDSPALAPILESELFILQNTSPYLLEGVPHTYEAMFETMFSGRCIFCHSGPEAKGDFDLSSYEGLLQGGMSGPGIVPGDPEASLVIQRQSGARDHFGQMLDEELEALIEWIAAGALEE